VELYSELERVRFVALIFDVFTELNSAECVDALKFWVCDRFVMLMLPFVIEYRSAAFVSAD
jgi:hypothetical protein